MRLLNAGDSAGLSAALMRDHYDPRYDRHRARHDDGRGRVVALGGLDDLDAAADRVEAALAGPDWPPGAGGAGGAVGRSLRPIRRLPRSFACAIPGVACTIPHVSSS